MKKISKKFNSFEDEEKWLMGMAKEGWRLVSYDSEDIEECTYKFVEDPNASKYNYQIDYRNFKKKLDYEEYKQLFEETGWTTLSKNAKYSKHIFISTSKENIFSDSATSLEREINRYKTAKVYVIASILWTISMVSLLYYFDFEISAFGGGATFGLFAIIYTTVDAVKRRKYIKNVKLEG